MADVMKRLQTVQSWWLGSQLVRRHPELMLIETHPGGGLSDCLSVVDVGRDGSGSTVVQLNREGGIHVRDQVGFMSWENELNLGDRHGAVRRIEAAAGLTAPANTPASTGKVLSYRAIASVLATLLNEREVWDARNYRFDSSNAYTDDPAFDLSPFPTAEAKVDNVRPDDLTDDLRYRFWGLLNEAEVVAILDTDGVVHLRDGQRSLVEAYSAGDRRLNLAITSTLGQVLP